MVDHVSLAADRRHPLRGVAVTTTRRRVHVEHELPMQDACRARVTRLISPEAAPQDGIPEDGAP
ncbi:hypothetical protein AB0H12_04315 [Actinosynnema sp. NPDC023794]